MPYAPGIQNRAGELMARGIERGGEAISEAIENYGRKRDELKGWKTLGDAIGLDTKGMTASQIKMKVAAREINQPAEEDTQKQADYQDQQTRRKAQDAFVAGVQGLMADKTNLSLPPIGGAAVPGVGENQPGMWAGLARSAQPNRFGGAFADGLITQRRGMDLGSAISAGLASPSAKGMSMEDFFAAAKAGGNRPPQMVTDPKSGASIWFDADKGTMHQPTAAKTPLFPPVPEDWDPPFKQVGGEDMYQPGPGRPFVPVKKKQNAADMLAPDEELEAYIPRGSKKPTPGLYRVIKDGKPVRWWQDPQAMPRSAASDLGLDNDEDEAPAKLPGTKAELQAGTVYQTTRGRAKWDGEQFVPQ